MENTLIGMAAADGTVAAMAVERLALPVLDRAPARFLQSWSRSPQQLRRLLEAGAALELGPDHVVFGDDAAGGRRRFGGALVFPHAEAFRAAAAERGCGLAALYGPWRLWWPWPDGARERACAVLPELRRAQLELRCARQIFAASRESPGRSGKASRGCARQLARGVHDRYAMQQHALVREALAALGEERGAEHPVEQRLLAATGTAGASSQHVAATEAALRAAECETRRLSCALRARVAAGELARREEPGWQPGRSAGAVDSGSPRGPEAAGTAAEGPAPRE